MARVRFWQNTVCRGAGRVREALQEMRVSALRVKQSNSRFRGRSSDVILNWGSQRDIPSRVAGNARILNEPSSIINSSNKLNAFRILEEAGMDAFIPAFTNDKDEAANMIEDGATVYCRTKLSSSKGRGIVIAEELEDLVDAPLYTSLIPCSREVRVHVFNGEVIKFAQKKRMGSERLEEEGLTQPHPYIRNYENGYVFAQSDVSIPQEAKDVAVRAIEELGLDFGSVDIILEEGSEHPIILEINTASGMEGSTVLSYAEAISALLSR